MGIHQTPGYPSVAPMAKGGVLSAYSVSPYRRDSHRYECQEGMMAASLTPSVQQVMARTQVQMPGGVDHSDFRLKYHQYHSGLQHTPAGQMSFSIPPGHMNVPLPHGQPVRTSSLGPSASPVMAGPLHPTSSHLMNSTLPGPSAVMLGQIPVTDICQSPLGHAQAPEAIKSQMHLSPLHGDPGSR